MLGWHLMFLEINDDTSPREQLAKLVAELEPIEGEGNYKQRSLFIRLKIGRLLSMVDVAWSDKDAEP